MRVRIPPPAFHLCRGGGIADTAVLYTAARSILSYSSEVQYCNGCQIKRFCKPCQGRRFESVPPLQTYAGVAQG